MIVYYYMIVLRCHTHFHSRPFQAAFDGFGGFGLAGTKASFEDGKIRRSDEDQQALGRKLLANRYSTLYINIEEKTFAHLPRAFDLAFRCAVIIAKNLFV